MNSMTDVYQNILTFGAFAVVGAVSMVSVFAALKADANGCHFSPDNAGCVMTRPIDIERNQETILHQPSIWVVELETF